MKIVVTDADPLGEVDWSRLERLGDVSRYPHSRPDEVAERVASAEIIITNKVVIGRDIIESCPGLKLICVSATGTDNVDKVRAEERGIPVLNVTGYSTYSVAQHTFACLLTLLEQVPYFDRYVKSGEYATSPTFTHLGPEFSELRGKTFGIIGMGDIGSQVGAIAAAFGARVIYHSRSEKDVPYSRVSLEELLSSADVITLHTPLTDETRGMLGAARLDLLKPEAILVNMARGGILDEAAAAARLDDGRLGGLVTDVFESEPCPADHPLLQIRNSQKLIATPHIAWASRESRACLFEKVCGHVEDFLARD